MKKNFIILIIIRNLFIFANDKYGTTAENIWTSKYLFWFINCNIVTTKYFLKQKNVFHSFWIFFQWVSLDLIGLFHKQALMVPAACRIHHGLQNTSRLSINYTYGGVLPGEGIIKILNYEIKLSINAQVPNNKVYILSNWNKNVHN